MSDTQSILAIDAAWTATEPTGVSLLQNTNGQWQCVALAPSYPQFYALAEGEAVDWSLKPKGEAPDIERLLNSAQQLLGQPTVSLITVDMPVSTIPILGRRQAETALSRAYARMGCAAHSPGPMRPGPIGTAYSNGCFDKGYQLGVTSTPVGTPQCLLEVYPHPALITLMESDYRVPYKAGKALKFWPDLSVAQRKAKLFAVYQQILNVLSEKIHNIDLELPEDLRERPFAHFKRYEDALDALVCGWVGMKYLAGQAQAYGDNTGAIWVPT
jgi:predicted RNase H-like nuclease